MFSPEAGIDSLNRFLVLRDYKDSTFFGYLLNVLGDINGDGVNDLLISRNNRGNAWADDSGFVFFGGSPPTSTFDTTVGELLSQRSAIIGDINGDGYPDIGNCNIPSPIEFQAYFGGPSFDRTPDIIIPDRNGRIAPAVDLDDDGNLEIALAYRTRGHIVDIYEIGTSADTIPKYSIIDTSLVFPYDIATGDFNGDNFSDLAISAVSDRPDPFVKFYWGGPDFDTVADFEIRKTWSRFGEILVPIGDFNADGYDDIFIGGAHNYPSGIFYGGPDIDTTMDLDLSMDNPDAHFAVTDACVVGDVNHDGYPDVALGYSNDFSGVYEIWLYLGGPQADDKVDVFIDNGALGHMAAFLGLRIFGIGDFNGDGIDDFAAYANTNTGCCWYSEVHFFAGWESNPTDVKPRPSDQLPSDFMLEQNYPNPFNLSTTIPFDVARRGRVEIAVYDILGRRVRQLVSQELSAGSYTIEWDGKDDRGQVVASGTYFYHLDVGESKEVKKMLLIK